MMLSTGWKFLCRSSPPRIDRLRSLRKRVDATLLLSIVGQTAMTSERPGRFACGGPAIDPRHRFSQDIRAA